MKTKTIIVIERQDDADHPFQLCVGIYHLESNTRLEHEDYPLTIDEFFEFRKSMLEVI